MALSPHKGSVNCFDGRFESISLLPMAVFCHSESKEQQGEGKTCRRFGLERVLPKTWSILDCTGRTQIQMRLPGFYDLT